MKQYILAVVLADGSEIKAVIKTELDPFKALARFQFTKDDRIFIIEVDDEQIERFKDDL
jgi:hypothetical protein